MTWSPFTLTFCIRSMNKTLNQVTWFRLTLINLAKTVNAINKTSNFTLKNTFFVYEKNTITSGVLYCTKKFTNMNFVKNRIGLLLLSRAHYYLMLLCKLLTMYFDNVQHFIHPTWWDSKCQTEQSLHGLLLIYSVCQFFISYFLELMQNGGIWSNEICGR